MTNRRPQLLIVSASRLPSAEFEASSLLGRSLRRLSYNDRIQVRASTGNRNGLPVVFNAQINEQNRDKILLFIHDDVWLDDYFVYERLLKALAVFDIVGLAGNIRRLPGQPAWGGISEDPFTTEDPQNLVGVVAHGDEPGASLTYFGGPPGRRCRLIDGVFIAANCETLLRSGVRFDERFLFDFYDMDFCRSAEAANLSIGTWPIAITHASKGNFGSPTWYAGLRAYRAKWNDYPNTAVR